MSQALLHPYWVRKVKVLIAQLCVTLFDCSPPCFSAHGISQTRILEWVAISFSRGSFRPRNWTRVSCIAGRFFTVWATRDWITNCIFFFFFKQDYQGLCGHIWNELHWRERSLEIRPRAWFSPHLQMGIWESLDITGVPTKNRKNPKTESQRTHKASKPALDILRHRTYQNRVCEIPSIC